MVPVGVFASITAVMIEAFFLSCFLSILLTQIFGWIALNLFLDKFREKIYNKNIDSIVMFRKGDTI